MTNAALNDVPHDHFFDGGEVDSGALHRFAMVIELKRDADDLGTGLSGQRGHNAAVDAA